MIRDQVIDHGFADVEEIERHEHTVDAGIVDLIQPLLVTAGGTAPVMT